MVLKHRAIQGSKQKQSMEIEWAKGFPLHNFGWVLFFILFFLCV
jgi:hypothetical protein